MPPTLLLSPLDDVLAGARSLSSADQLAGRCIFCMSSVQTLKATRPRSIFVKASMAVGVPHNLTNIGSADWNPIFRRACTDPAARGCPLRGPVSAPSPPKARSSRRISHDPPNAWYLGATRTANLKSNDHRGHALPGLRECIYGGFFPLTPLRRRGLVSDCARLPDGRWIVTGRLACGAEYIWDVMSGKLRREIAGHSEVIVAAAFDPTSTRLVTVSTALDEEIYIWDLETGQVSLTLDLPTKLTFAIRKGSVFA
ncbi:hypothetical protein V8D89_007375 [Ganoderma adspersum]